MKKTKLTVLLAFLLSFALVFSLSACGKKQQKADEPAGNPVAFTLIVVDGEGNEKTFNLESSEKTVGAALLKEGLISGEEGQYGLYVKVVDGIEADYNKDGTYWAFYIGGEYANTGVDATDLTEGETYTLKVEK